MNRREPREIWEKRIEAFRASGMTQRAYCESNGVKIKAFHYHLMRDRKLRGGASGSNGGASGWMPLIIDDMSCPRPGGIRIRIGRVTVEADPGFDAIHLSEVLRAVGSMC